MEVTHPTSNCQLQFRQPTGVSRHSLTLCQPTLEKIDCKTGFAGD